MDQGDLPPTLAPTHLTLLLCVFNHAYPYFALCSFFFDEILIKID